MVIMLLALFGIMAQSNSTAAWLAMGGALLGGGWSLLMLTKLWVAQLQQNDDPALRNFASGLHEVGHAMTRRPPS